MAANDRPSRPYKIYADKEIHIVDSTGADLVIIDASGNIKISASAGIQIGTLASQKLALWGKTPIVQRAGSAQAAVVTTGATNSSPYGFTAAAQADAIVTLINEMRTALVNAGIIKGSA